MVPRSKTSAAHARKAHLEIVMNRLDTTALMATGRAPLDPCQEQALGAVEGQRRVTPWPYHHHPPCS